MKINISSLKGYVLKNIGIFVLLFIAIFPKFNIMPIPKTYIGIRFEDFIAFGIGIFLIFRLLKNKNFDFKSKNLNNLIIIFLIYIASCVISTIWGIYNNYISIPMSVLYLMRKVEYFLFIFVGYFHVNDKEGIYKTINFIILFHFIVCVLQLNGIIGSINRGEYTNLLIQNRVCSTFNGAYELSAFLLLLLPIYLYNIFSKKIRIISSIIYVIMIGFMIFACQSRTSLVIFLFIIALMFMKYNRKLAKGCILVGIPATLIVVFCITRFNLESKLGLSRFEDFSVKQISDVTRIAWKYRDFDEYVKNGTWYSSDLILNNGNGIKFVVDCDPSLFVRVNHWMQLVDGFTRSPFVGTGLSISQTAADGNYIRVIAESGLFGFALWSSVQILIILHMKKNNKLNVIVRFAMYSLLLGAIFIDVFEASKVMMAFYIILGLAYRENKENDEIKYKEKNIENAIIVNDFNYVQGGASKVAIDTARMLKDCGINVYFFCADYNKKECIDGVEYITTNQIEALKDKNKLRGAINGIYNFKAANKMNMLLKTLKPENTIIHIHGWTKAISCSVYDVARKNGFNIVLTSHDYFTACPNGGFFNYKTGKICEYKPLSAKCLRCNCDSRNYFFKLYRVIRQFVQNNIVRMSETIENVIGISDNNIKIVKENLNKNVSISKVLNPIDFVTKSDRIKVENNDVYLYIGRVAKEKGIDFFCSNISKLKLKGIVVGDGTKLQELKSQYQDIEFVGWKNKNEIEEYIKRSRIFVFPSMWYEGAPLTPLEVMSYGIPCLVSSCSSAKEYITCKNGEIFDISNEEDFKEKLDVINSDIETYSKNAFEYMIQFSKNDYIDNLTKVYKKIGETYEEKFKREY